MKKRDLNISFYKAGNTLATRLNLPIPWVRQLNITPESREIELLFDEEKEEIIIRKKK
ncbi:AbrB/MazE/SpoVT family DNA-binding domain-containing protein [Leptotrichia sp. OH3620_COT-345]|uniref:AbrB/MazE/SpoVT family DNA-binding domain-containing protein n=1 Tax=Leptotrichia sp. OH3620_COT-345 TaxID=2491048 RepID=UPI000F64891D|nr:AbrB/MazE/SpoVT family DNA-binding domain-containing protein [Leptotrichia sp. OH3620_COT-345]RRD38793.1 AbrB/MazE/SpoVT family DNA-binding domain-containing protein [Leptotrichia sp. OH3620_COT-345]